MARRRFGSGYAEHLVRVVPALLAVMLAVMLASSLLTAEPQSTPARRIVSLVPAVTETLFAMGAGETVVGVSSYDNYPAKVASLPRVGALVDPDFERILGLRPDLAIVYASAAELVTRLERAGIRVFRYRHGGLADIATMIRGVGTHVGRTREAELLVRRIEADIEEVQRAVAGRRRPSTLLIFTREAGTLRGIYASAGVGFLHDMLIAAGGTDVLADVPRESLQMSVEAVLARAPEVILELHPSGVWTPERLARERAAWATLRSVPAVRSGRIHILADDLLSIPGPRVGAAVRRLADALHPEIARK